MGIGRRGSQSVPSSSRTPVSLAVALLLFIGAPIISAQTVTTNITNSVPGGPSAPGNLGTVITPAGTTTTITGGTRNGGNLFHSFGNFSVGAGNTADFNNNTGAATTNILSRVTGGNVSNIFGTLKTTNFGNAALWLINPAGVVFGPTASLNVGGSVHISTADYLRLGNGNEFFYADLNKNSTLTSAPVTAFGFLRNSPAPITVQRDTVLEVPQGETLSLIGGDLTITGGPDGFLSAGGGRINLISVASPGELNLAINGKFETSSFSQLGKISLLDQASVSTGATAAGSILVRSGKFIMDESVLSSRTVDAGGGGIDINVQTMQLTNRSRIQTASTGTGQAGDVTIQANELSLLSSSRIQSTTSGNGKGGNIEIKANTVSVSGGSTIMSSTDGDQNAGMVNVNAGESVSIGETSPGFPLFSTVGSQSRGGSGAGGTVTIDAPSITVTTGGRVSVDNSSMMGESGNILLKGEAITLAGGGQLISTTTSAKSGGTITIFANDFSVRGVDLFGTTSKVSTDTSGKGNAGDISITATNFTLEGGDISAGTHSSGLGNAGNIDIHVRNAVVSGGGDMDASSFSDGRAGRITIEASNSLSVSGSDVRGHSSSISSTTTGSADAGEIRLHAPIMTISEGANVTTIAQGLSSGKAGSISLQADQLNILNGGLVDSTMLGAGEGGSITINASQQLTLSGSNAKGISQISTSILGPRTAGEVTIDTPRLQVNGGLIKANTGAEGRAGSVTINADELSLTNGAQIVSRATKDPTTHIDGIGDAGRITVKARDLFSSQGSTVSSSANSGAGGDVSITAGNLQLTGGSTVSAQSSGPKDAGGIKLASGSDIFLQNSTVSTFADQASGGNIKLTAPGTVQLDNAKITSSVNGPAGNGGNITIDPQFVILEHGSQILAKAVGGNGGNISIVANTFLAEPGTDINASSATGISGTVNIQSPIQNLSGAIAPLPQNLISSASLYAQRCAAQKGGHFSSLTQGTRDGVPPQPGDYLPSPLLVGAPPALSSSGRESKSSWQLIAERLGLQPDPQPALQVLAATGCPS